MDRVRVARVEGGLDRVDRLVPMSPKTTPSAPTTNAVLPTPRLASASMRQAYARPVRRINHAKWVMTAQARGREVGRVPQTVNERYVYERGPLLARQRAGGDLRRRSAERPERLPGADRPQALDSQGQIKIAGAAVVTRDPDGRLEVKSDVGDDLRRHRERRDDRLAHRDPRRPARHADRRHDRTARRILFDVDDVETTESVLGEMSKQVQPSRTAVWRRSPSRAWT